MQTDTVRINIRYILGKQQNKTRMNRVYNGEEFIRLSINWLNINLKRRGWIHLYYKRIKLSNIMSE